MLILVVLSRIMLEICRSFFVQYVVYYTNLLQGLNQDVQAHEPTIQSAKDKAKELASKSPDSKVINDTAQIVEQYGNLQTTVKVRVLLYVCMPVNQIMSSNEFKNEAQLRLKIEQEAHKLALAGTVEETRGRGW